MGSRSGNGIDLVVIVMKRRKFLKAGAIAIAAGGLGGWLLFRKSRAQIMYEALRRELFYLKISEEDARRFAADLSRKMYIGSRFRGVRIHAYQLYATYYRTMNRQVTVQDVHLSYEKFNQFVVVNFLLSSDFFLNGANEAVPVRYKGLYDPGVHPCANPFS